MGLVAALALGSSALSACKKNPEKAESHEQASPPLDPAAVKESFERLKAQVKDQIDGYQRLRARINDYPADLIGLSTVKEKIGQTESVLGALAGRTDWLKGELESALQANDGARIQAAQAQVESIAADLKLTGKTLVDSAHDLQPYDEAVVLQTSWTYQLPNGFEVKAAPGGLERRLIDFSTDPKRTFEPHSWYRFDRVYFLDIKTEMDRERSSAQLTNVVEILKAFPTISLDLSAFDRDAQRIAEVREMTTGRIHVLKKELESRGVPAARLKVLEFGPDCPPDSPERCPGSAAARPVRK